MVDISLVPMWNLMNTHKITVVSDHSLFICDICNKLMVNAHISKCGCQFCKLCLKAGALECPAGHVTCSSQSLVILVDHSANIKISKLRVICPNVGCECEMELGKLEEHMMECEVGQTECPYLKIGCDKKEENKESLFYHLQAEMVSHSHLLMEVIDNLKNELDLIKEDLKQRDMRAQSEKDALQQRFREEYRRDWAQEEDDQINSAAVRSKQSKSEVSCTINESKKPSHNNKHKTIGEISWMFSNFYEKFLDATHWNKVSVYSDQFLSHKNGYTLCLVMNPCGYASGKGSHLYVGFNILRGKFDDELPWPFMGSITISLIDRMTHDKRYVRKYDYGSVDEKMRFLFDKPSYRANHCWGDPKLIPLPVLYDSPTLLTDNSLVVNCTVVPFQS